MVEFATYKLYVDWNHNGLYDHANAEIYTGYVEDDDEVTFKRGRDRQSQLVGRSSPGDFNVTLKNSSRIFSKFYTSSPVYGLIKPGRRIKFTMQIGAGSEVTIFAGRLKNIESSTAAQRSDYKATLTATGVLGFITKTDKVNIPMQTAIASGTAFGTVLDGISWPAADRSIDAGRSTLVRYWTGGEINALQALRDIEDTEAGFIRETKDGKIAFEDRSHRYLSPHTVSQATYTNDVSGTIRYAEIHPIDTLDDVYNIVKAQVRTFNLSAEKELISLIDLYNTEGNLGDPLGIDPGQTITIELKYPSKSSANNEISVSSWTNVTYEANSAYDGTGSDLTDDVIPVDDNGDQILEANNNLDWGKYDNKRILKMKNTGLTKAYLIVLKADGIAVVEGDGFQVSNDATIAAVAQSILDYGPCDFPFPGRFLTAREEAQAFCDYFADLYKEPRTAITLTLLGNSSVDHLTEVQTRDVSDRITVVSDEGLSGDYFVEQIQHKIWKNGLHQMTLTCSAVAGTEWAASNYTYVPKTVPNVLNTGMVPDQIFSRGMLAAARIIFAAQAKKYGADVDGSELRVQCIPSLYYSNPSSVDLRTPAEGGSFAHNGVTQFIIENLSASWQGARWRVFFGANTGRWFFAWRLHNAAGWSTWTDGNTYPKRVEQFVDTDDDQFSDTGPAADFTSSIRKGPQTGTAEVVVTRPSTQGRRIWFVQFHIKNKNTGSWVALDAGTGASEVRYDGSAVDHTWDPEAGTITAASGNFDGDVLTKGGLMLIDQRQGSFNHKYCSWAWVDPSQFRSGSPVLTGFTILDPAFPPEVDGTFTGLRIKIVRPPWEWDNDGYLGNPGYNGLDTWDNETTGDLSSVAFVSKPFVIPAGLAITDLEARVWFGTPYSFSDDDYHCAAPTASGDDDQGVIRITSAATITIDCALGSIFYIDLDQNATLANFINMKHGKPIIVVVRQDVTGGWTLALDTKFTYGSEIAESAVVIDTTALSRNYFGFIYDENADVIDVVAFVSGYQQAV